MMENKFTFKNVVTLVRYRPETASFVQTLDLFQGIQGVPTNTKIPNKPTRSHLRKFIKTSIWPKEFF
jgi:hypothetical protein